MNQTKEEILNEVLKGIGNNERLGIKRLNCDDISPWGFDEVSKYIITELDKLGYKLYAFHYEEDGKPTGETSGLKITWE